ncbi:MAG TPA: quinol:electron acceptor oxidoreductase subunit ActD [Nitrospiraceae bacterium]|nr:quinol:electron acceptor oxidoreductase subunit ActD [Nitrospiraceae bacterium]
MGAPQDREISALFQPGTDMSAVITQLQRAGVTREDIALCSPLPLEHLSPTARAPLLPYFITIAAGVIGIGVGLFFAGGTAALYPLETGGKAIVAAPVVGIISYETMMLLAVLATFITMIVRIVGDQGRASTRDQRVDDGMVAVVVPVTPSGAEAILLQVLEQAGATDITIRPRQSVQPGWEPSSQALAVWLSAIVLCASLPGCSRDMQDQPSYHPQEAPRLHSPTGSVPRDSRVILPPARQTDAAGSVWGERIYRVNCLHCHGPSGEGNGPVAAYLKERPADLLSRSVQEKPQSELYEIVTDGKDMMPPFRGELSAAERRAVAGFVKQLASHNDERGSKNGE